MNIRAHYNGKEFSIQLDLDIQGNILVDYDIEYDYGNLSLDEQYKVRTLEENLLFSIVDGDMSHDTIDVYDYDSDGNEELTGVYKFKIDGVA